MSNRTFNILEHDAKTTLVKNFRFCDLLITASCSLD